MHEQAVDLIREEPSFDLNEGAFRLLLELIPAAAYTCDPEGLITFFNRHAKDVWGRAPRLNDSSDRFCGSFRLFYADGSPMRHEDCWMAQALKKGVQIDGREVTIERQDGTRRSVLAHASPLRNSKGELLGAVNVLVDITERQSAEAAQAQLAAIVSSSQDAIVSKTLDGHVVTWNAGAERIFGYTSQEMVGRPISVIIPPERQAEEHEILTRLRRGERIEHFETERVDKHGRRVAISLTISPIHDRTGRIIGASKVARDITARDEVERQRRDVQRKFELFMRNLPGLAWIKDLEGRYVYVNHAAEGIFGGFSDTIVGRTDAEIFPPETAEQFVRNDQQALNSLDRVETVESLAHENGLHHSLVTKFPIFGDDNRPQLIGGIAIDITERKLAESALKTSEEQFHTFADSIPQLAWVARPDGYIFWYNRRWYDYSGTTPEAMEGWGWQAVHDPAELPRVLKKFKAAIANCEPWEDTFPLRRHDGAMRWHLSRMQPVFDEEGRLALWCGTNTDVTEQREADRRKDEFLAMLAHELRNPLAPLSNSLSLMSISPSRVEAESDIVEIMQQQVRHMERLVDDLLEVSRITRGKIILRTENANLADIVRDAVATSRPLIDAARHDLTVTIPPAPISVCADRMRLAQVISNLLNNAAKYTDEGGRIALSVERDGEHACIRVRDNGWGIPADMLEGIFEMFAQADRTLNRARGGLGIGLTLARTLVELHGGRIRASSEGSGQGSEFCVRIPLAIAGSTGPHARAAGNRSRRYPSRRVLVVDDMQAAGYILAKLLEKMGQSVQAVASGQAALDAASDFEPEVIISDISMPGMDGYELARQLRNQREGSSAVLVALTGHGQDGDRRAATEAGFDHHLTKPVSLEDLQSLLESLA